MTPTLCDVGPRDGLQNEAETLEPATRADLLTRLDRPDEARVAYDEALALAGNDTERAFLRDRLAHLAD